MSKSKVNPVVATHTRHLSCKAKGKKDEWYFNAITDDSWRRKRREKCFNLSHFSTVKQWFQVASFEAWNMGYNRRDEEETAGMSGIRLNYTFKCWKSKVKDPLGMLVSFSLSLSLSLWDAPKSACDWKEQQGCNVWASVTKMTITPTRMRQDEEQRWDQQKWGVKKIESIAYFASSHVLMSSCPLVLMAVSMSLPFHWTVVITTKHTHTDTLPLNEQTTLYPLCHAILTFPTLCVTFHYHLLWL